MGKKKIAFILGGAIVGGVEFALKQMLEVIDREKYEIYLFTNILGNPCVEGLDEEIHICDLDEFDLRGTFFDALKKKNFLRASSILIDYVLARVSKSTCMKLFYAYRPLSFVEEVFDCVIAFKPVYISVIIALFKIKAKKRIVWIHGEIIGGKKPNKKYLKWMAYFDKAFCVSQATLEYFEEVCPAMKGRAEIFYNIIDSKRIRAEAGNNKSQDDGYALTTVGRLSCEKGQDMIPPTARLLLDAGYNFKWYIVGDGPLREVVEEKCREYGVTENIIFTGTLSNPYPYIKSCNVYVQTSYSEGYCTTTMEAKILGKPVVTTDAPGMREQFVNGENGLIVESMTPAALFGGIKSLLDDPALCQKFKDTLKEETHDNSRELEKLYAFIES